MSGWISIVCQSKGGGNGSLEYVWYALQAYSYSHDFLICAPVSAFPFCFCFPHFDSSSSLPIPLLTQVSRQILASSNAFIVHEPKTPIPKQQSSRNGIGANASIAPQCMQYYVEPIEWMRDELEKGALDGKLNCPKCKAKLGSYKWQGSKCSCGKWCTPAIELTRSKVDEMLS